MRHLHAHRLPRSKILHNKACLRDALSSGRRIHHRYFTCIRYPLHTSASASPVAFLVNKKCGHATIRNRLKRIFREAWRQMPEYHPPNTITLWIIKPEAHKARLCQIQEAMRSLHTPPNTP